MLEKIWVEKYRPKQIKHLIGNENLKKSLQDYLDKGEIPNILLYGPPGTGKTTIAKIVRSVLDCDHLFINGSDENNVETVRNKIGTFGSSVSFSKLNLVMIDECLDENTLVTIIRNGEIKSIKIKNLDEKNDLVKSFNIEKEQIEWRPFLLLDKGERNCLELEFENGEKIVCTENHKWYVNDENGKIIEVLTKDLKNYQYVLTTDID